MTTSPKPALHSVCGKIAAGKSSLAAKLGNELGAVVISEDEWLPKLFPGEIKELADYARCSARLRDAMGPHVTALLRAGVPVVLDFPANRPNTRQWALSLAQAAGVPHVVHWLDVPDAVCKERLRVRNEAGLHPYRTDEAEFERFTQLFVPPAEGEGYTLVRHPA